MRFMLSARLRVTLMGRPSGTDTTMSVTAIIKLFRSSEITAMGTICSIDSSPLAVSKMNVNIATT